MADENDLNININADPSGVESGSKRAGAAIKGIAGNTKELEAALNKFRASIDPTFAAMQKYNKAHQDNLALLRADIITRKEYNAGMKAAKAAMDAEIEAINRRSAAGRAAAAEERARRQADRAAERAAAQADAAAARQAAQAKREAERAAREEAKAAAKAEAQAIRDAAAAARLAAREKQQEERAAAAAARQAASEQRRQEKQEIREAARVAREAAREKARAEKDAAREAAAAVRQAKREEREATMTAAREAKQQAREKAQAERQASRDAAAAERQAKREAAQAAREAAAAAKAAAKEKATAEREAAKAAREAAAEVERMAKAEKMAAAAANDLRASIDPTFAAQERYNQAMRTATQLLMQGKLRAGEFTQIMRQQKAQMDVNVRSMGRMNAMNVQIGYQMQDVVASWASGISPLVILAQQGGQTAAALSTMGGRAGAVAAFFAGPWGAAILGATMVLGYLWTSMDEGKKKTKDLMDAEDRRIMTLKELTEALRDYIKEQQRSNDTTAQGLIANRNLNYSDLTRKTGDLATAEKELADARARLAAIGPMPTGKGAMEAWAGQVAMATAQVKTAETKVNDLKGAINKLSRAVQEDEIALASHRAEQTQADKDYETAKQRLMVAYRNETKGVTDANILNQKRLKLEADLRAAADALAAAKERESAARRENAAAARAEERATFSSRTDAIGVAGRELKGQGFSVTENNQFGGVTGGHANNGEHAKYAIDVGIPGFGPNNPEASSEVARKKMDEIARAYQARGFRVIWNGKTYMPGANAPVVDFVPAKGAKGDAWHRSHMDIKAPESIVGQPQGGRLGNELAREMAEAEKQAAAEAMQAKLANFEFEQELNRENLQEVLRIQEEKITAIKAFYGEDSKEAIDAGREKVRIERSIAREALQIRREQIDQTLALMMQSYETEKSLAELNMEERRAVIGFAEQQGIISARDAIIAKAALLDQEFQDQIAHENRMYQAKVASMQATLTLENLPLDQKRRIQDELERAEADHLGRMRLLNAQYNRDVNNMQRDAQAVQMGKWREFASSFSGSLGQAMQGLWMRNITLQQAFINMADQQIFRLIDMGAKAVENWIMQQLKMTGVQQAQEAARTAAAVGGEGARTAAAATGEATRTGIGTTGVVAHAGMQTAKTGATIASEAIQTGAKATGEATRTSVGAAGAMAEIGTRAATSAAGAFSSTVVIPFIGPVAAPVAAAAALAAVLGFGALVSSSGGQGEVPRDGQLSMLHKKETVLPAWIAEPMRQMFVSPRSSGGMMAGAAAAGAAARSDVSNSSSNNFYYQPKHHNMGASFDTLLKRDGRSLRRWLKNEIRNGGLSLS